MKMEERERKLVEYGVEALIIAWLGYLFLYQNYLLRNWHRGLPLPSRWPFELGGIAMGAAFFAYEYVKLMKKTEASEKSNDVLPRDAET
ncbi:hypothetical protein [Thermococcus sp.]|jgi:hypothetical protein|uniref:hypothetical protein n=1 Tax=Thermococcus sp. TaxID=35749 RepID=UPI002621531C|nr:hypothetical protein [Thermococcus sp.]